MGVEMPESKTKCYEFDDFRLDTVNRQLLENGRPVSLTRKSYELLLCLVENSGRIIRKEELLDALWEGEFVEEANLTQHVYLLRKALRQKERDRSYIETIPKNGYRFQADVRLVPDVETDVVETELPAADRAAETVPHRWSEDHSTDDGTGSARLFADEPLRLPDPHTRPKVFNGTYKAVFLISLLLVPAIVLLYFNVPPVGSRSSGAGRELAVLPFRQITGEKDVKLGIGLTDVLIARLSGVEGLNVRPTSFILRYRDGEMNDPVSVGRELEVEYVLVGVVQREEDMVRVSVQLFDVGRKRQVWTQTFDETDRDMFKLQDRISDRIVRTMSMKPEKGRPETSNEAR